jgi:hypothetical protein
MNRRIWTGAIAGVLAALVLLTVGFGAYRAGQDNPDDDAVRVVSADVEPGEEGEATQVVRVDDDRHGRPPFGFFLFPLVVILLIAALVWGRRWGGGWHRPYGPPYGPDPRSHWFDEWHRRAHEEGGAGQPAPASASETPSGETPPGTTPPSGGSA